MERLGRPVALTYEANPGEVWEENEFWIELSWRIDPDGTLGIRKHFESPYRPGEKITVDEYYRWMFENTCRGCQRRAAAEGLTPLAYMRKYGAFEVENRPASYNDADSDASCGADKLTGDGVVWSPSAIRNSGDHAAARSARTETLAGGVMSMACVSTASRHRHVSWSSFPHAGRLGLAGVRHADLYQQPCAPRQPRSHGR